MPLGRQVGTFTKDYHKMCVPLCTPRQVPCDEANRQVIGMYLGMQYDTNAIYTYQIHQQVQMYPNLCLIVRYLGTQVRQVCILKINFSRDVVVAPNYVFFAPIRQTLSFLFKLHFYLAVNLFTFATNQSVLLYHSKDKFTIYINRKRFEMVMKEKGNPVAQQRVVYIQHHQQVGGVCTTIGSNLRR